MLERIQKLIARSGLASRRQAEIWIRDGLVTVNGKKAQLGDKAELSKDAIKVKGRLMQSHTPEALYLLLYKPRGVISMVVDDEQGRPTLKDYIKKNVRTKVFPVGRMEFNTEGLLLLTNDGKFNQEILQSPELPRVYHVKCSGTESESMLKRIQKGTLIDGRITRPYSARVVFRGGNKFKIELVFLGMGNVDIKELLQRVGLNVDRIQRVAIGHLKAGSMKPGTLKLLRQKDAEILVKRPDLFFFKKEKYSQRSIRKKASPQISPDF